MPFLLQNRITPHGGRRGVYTPNPIAVGFPTEDVPVLIDISASITTFGLAARLHGEGRRLPGEWVIDPEAFGGLADFKRQMQWLAQACRATPPRSDAQSVRMPGERGLAHRADQLANGVQLYSAIVPALTPWSEKLGVTLPRPC